MMIMYVIAVKREFDAQHYLIGGDWGAENELHTHQYQVEVQLQGATLDQHGYLVDIVDIEDHLDSLVERYRGKTLNDQPKFAGLNPSIENFTRIFYQQLVSSFETANISSISVKIWENEIAWASYQHDIS
jgi:6-pyruvoyltetrahydropterin/6-carboxytetrahydropterin synthase